ncbi:hypothetical protein FOZ60_001838 [Perkinsus olseni]|uniref:Uncharacterized protein n=1 Tax=Perkinsus olseni TaxID=32597 RepID=A0A7J6PJ47_PEROL|nr:hypothetical protein FOZ60_001838 [Perkinsus olseni]
MLSVIVVLLSLVHLNQSLDHDIVNLAFVGFQEKHGKRYENEAEEKKRADIFKANLDYIEKVNSQNLPYKLGVNKHFDLTFDEFAAKMLHPIVVDRSAQAGLLTEDDDLVDLPASIDWRTEKVLNPVKDQEECGSCWAFSANGALESRHAIATGTLLSLSEQQLVDCSSKDKGCKGGLMSDAFEYVQEHGIDDESAYPYKGSNGTCKTKLTSYPDGLLAGEVIGYRNLSQTDAALKKALVSGPVSLAVNVDENFHKYRSGLFNASSCSVGANLNHGVVAVGYGTTPEGHDYYIIRNSWGDSWGEDGYIYMKRGDNSLGRCNMLEMMSVPKLRSD